jgi:hypothetical protein
MFISLPQLLKDYVYEVLMCSLPRRMKGDVCLMISCWIGPTTLERVLFTQDDDLLREAAERQRHGVAFAGVIYGHQLNVTIGQCIRDLELLARVNEPEDCANRVEYLPLG